MSLSLRGTLKNSYSVIRKELRSRDVSAWLCDNFYLIDKHYRAVLKNRKALSFKRLYDILKKHCDNRDYNIGPDSVTACLKAEKDGFTYYELSAVSSLLSACAVIKIGEMLVSRKGMAMLPNTVKLLIDLSDPRYSDIIPAVWKPESLIAEFEPDHSLFSAGTRSQYRALLAEYARRKGISETEAAKKLISEAKKKKCVLGTLLFRPNKSAALAWMAISFSVWVLLSVTGFCAVGWLTLLLAVPFGVAAASISDRIISVFVPAYTAPRLELDSVPDNAKTLVTVAALISGDKSDESVFESLVRFRYMNPDENIYFCLLADLPDSDKRSRPEDSETIESAKRKIDELNALHGDRFCLFFRERVLNKSEGRFGGRERKRGAVCELVSHITHGGKREYYGGDFIRKIKYILTLDSDTNLSVGSVKDMLFVALHPVNRPVVSKGKVVSGYGIIQPVIRTELSSAYRTGFSRLISGAGGADIYANAAFQRSQALFGSGSFCGKGLIDVALFDSLVSNKLPDGLVLSHDVIEGSIMRTLSASDITLTDSTPGNTVSFFRRQHRWLRGDFQNLYFLKGSLLDVFSKLRLFVTVLRHSSPVFSLIAVAAGCFLAETSGFLLFILAYSEFFVPCVLSVVGFLVSGSPFACLRFFSKAYSLLTQTLLRLLFEISASCRKAVLTLHAFSLSAVRLVTRKKTLEWMTAATAEKLSSSLGKYVIDSVSSVLIGLLILIFAKPPFMRFCGLLYFVYPFISYILSRPVNGGAEARPQLTDKQKKMLFAHASDMFRFYHENVGPATNFLPPDNIQLSPVYSVAMRTSPTNIGFYLVSLLAARDLKLIGTKELYERLEASLTVIEKLDKYKGNLYNWYDISELSVIGDRYVSTVDSGNFVVMLVALKEGLSEYSDEEYRLTELIKRIETLIASTDLTVFYDKRRDLFRIGLRATDEKADEGCYDLLMSEARMTAYYSVAASIVPKKHWQSLGRTLTHRSGYIGMLSWSGTAFEYLMPQLFLPLYRDSFMFESVAFSLMIQRSENGIWGVSESGFYSFDSDMHYQYKANGLQPLALRRVASDERIASPYSTYLSLCVLGNAAVKNLRDLENRGMYGKYGLYEALDMNSGAGGICVKSYMAHHVGMSIIACLNAINDNIFVRRFMSDKRMGSANELLQEKIPIEAHVFEDDSASRSDGKHPVHVLRGQTEKADLLDPSVALLSRGDMAVTVSSSGHIGITCGEKLIANTEFDKFSLRFSPAVIFTRGGKSFGCAPLCGKCEGFGFERGSGFASHIASGKDFSGRVRFSLAENCNCLVIATRAEALKKYDVSFVFEPVMETKKKFLSHISFSRLFVESEYDKTKRILYFHRRSGLDGSHVFTVAVAPRDKDMSFSFLTSRENFKASSVSGPLDYAFAEPDNKVGECIDPLCFVKTEDAEGGRCAFLLTCGETKRECERNIRLARTQKGDYRAHMETEMLERMLPALLYGSGGRSVERFTDCGIGDLWSKGISGDHPLAVISVSEPAVTRTETLLKAFLHLARLFIKCELIFLVSDSDLYHRPAETAVRECCNKTGASQYIGRNGGIFILREQDLSHDMVIALKQTARFCLDFGNDTPRLSSEPESSFDEIITAPQNAAPLITPSDGMRSRNGYFLREGFAVDKSRLPDAPYSFILTGYRFSTVLTQSSLGYTFFDNARERRLCSFFGDIRSLDNGERIFALVSGKKYDLCAVSNKVCYEAGKATYHGEIEGEPYSVTVTVPPKFPVKLIRVRYQKAALNTRFELQPVMGDSVSAVSGIEIMPFRAGDNSCLMFRNPFGMTFPEGRGFAGVCGGNAEADKCALDCAGGDIIFFLGACMTENGAREVARRVDKGFFDSSVLSAYEFARSMLPDIKVSTGDMPNDVMMNFFLPYQVSACRFYARGSFYQSGGAYGFRDQLQDCLSIIYSSPQTVRTHLIRCCAHQYIEGSVMHWWHTRRFEGVNRGIKSKCSDDLLYLPIVTADYLEKTGDKGLLDVRVKYLVSPPLGEKSERYEQPVLSEIKETVYDHCLRALRYADRRGKNGLILMGSCDWNDAFSLVGEKGRGESVFSTLLYIIAAEAFIPIAEQRGDNDSVNALKNTVSDLRNAVENNAFFGDRYARAFCDDGTVLGIEESGECKIDILSQAFAAIAGLDKERSKNALSLAFSRLYDAENRIFRLFSPPFANGNALVGYIRGYVAGIRENGGQYTHGALWGALGYIIAGMKKEALLILDCANPASRSLDKTLTQKYKTEPYAVAADIYSGRHGGRGGWSWYTGAASWYYRIMLEYVLGIKLGAGKKILSAEPLIAYNAELTIDGTRLHILSADSIDTPLLNGRPVLFPLTLPDKDSILELPII